MEQSLADAVIDFAENWMGDAPRHLTAWQRRLIRLAFAEPLQPISLQTPRRPVPAAPTGIRFSP